MSVLKFDITFDTKIVLDYLVTTIGGNDPWIFSGPLVNNTEAEYDALYWTDTRSRPSWATLQSSMTNAVPWYYNTFYEKPGNDYYTVGSSIYALYLLALSKLSDKADSSAVPTNSQFSALESEVDGKASLSHTHAQSDVTGLATSLASKADSVHSHSISDVTSLSANMAAKSDVGHTHTISNVTALQSALDGKQASLGFTAVPDTRTVNGYALSSNVTLSKGDVGLSNVDNTSDASKPISTATQTALNGKAASSHSHAVSDVTGLQAALDEKLINSFTVSTPSRSLNTNFQPNATKACLVMYTISCSASMSLTSGQTGEVQLISDSSSTPSTVRERTGNSNSGALTIGLALTNGQQAVLVYLVPAGHYVRLASSSTATISIVNQAEIAFG